MQTRIITEKAFEGPWLVDRDALKKLDAIVNNDLSEYMVVITTREEKEHIFSSLGDALAAPILMNEYPIELRISGSEKDRWRPFLQLGYKRNQLQINTTTLYNESPDQQEKLFQALCLWAEEHQSPTWQKLWERYYGLHFLIPFIAVFTWVILTLITVEEYKEVMGQIRSEEATTLLMDGISIAEQPKAIELLLTYQLNLDAPPKKPNSNFPQLFLLLVPSLLLTLILSIKPRTHLGIGTGMKSISNWRVYINVVFYIIPTLLLSGFIIPFVYALFFD